MSNYLPWGRLGFDVRDAKSYEEVLEFGALNWGLTKAPLIALITVDGEELRKSAHKMSTITRNDTNEIIGIVGKTFLPIPNNEALGIMDALSNHHEIKVEKAGELFGGESIFCTAYVPMKNSKNETIKFYYVLRNSHNGKSSIELQYTPIHEPSKTVLNVTVPNAYQKIKIRHTGKTEQRLQEAIKVVREGTNYFHSVQDQFELLAETSINNTSMTKVLDEIMPLPMEARPAKTQNARNVVEELFQSGGNLSGMGLFLAIANYADHHTAFKSTTGTPTNRDENRFVNVMEGASQKLKSEALKAILS